MMETNKEQTSPPPVGDRRLRRSNTDKMLAGVAGGLAQRLDIPAWVVRVAFIVLAIGGGAGVALYVAAWLLTPAEGETEPLARSLFDRVQGNTGWIGIALIAVGALIVADSIGFIRGDLAVAVVLGVVGVLLYRGELGGRSEDAPPDSDAPPTTPGPLPSSATSAAFAASTPDGGGTVPPPYARNAVAQPPRPPAPKRPPSNLGRLTVAVTLIAVGVMSLFDYALSTFDPTPRHYLGLAVGIVGGALLLGSWFGRARGLIFVGVLLTPLLVLAPVAEADYGRGIGQRRVTFTQIEQLSEPHNLAIGEMILDLRQLDFAGQTVTLEASLGIGSLQIMVPRGVGVQVASQVGIGEAQSFGAIRSGFGRELRTSRDGDGLIVIDARTLVGEVRVTDGLPRFGSFREEN